MLKYIKNVLKIKNYSHTLLLVGIIIIIPIARLLIPYQSHRSFFYIIKY